MRKLIIISILLISFALSADEYLKVPQLTKKEVKILSSFDYELLHSKTYYFEEFNTDTRFVYTFIRFNKSLSEKDEKEMLFLRKLYGLKKNASMIQIFFTQLKLLQIRIFILKRMVHLKKIEVTSTSSEREKKKANALIKHYTMLIEIFNVTIEGSEKYFRYTKKEW